MNLGNLNNNTVNLSGTIASTPVYSHNIYGEGFYETAIEVSRLSAQMDIIPITVSERLIENNNIEIGKMVTIIGQFRSYNKMSDNRSKLMLTVFVREVQPFDGAANPNTIDLIGYVCKEPIFRTTPFKREICDVLIAVNRAYNKSDYIPTIAWGRNARFAKSLSIGEKVALSGRIQSREYQKMNEIGEYETRLAYEISVNRICQSDADDISECSEIF